MTLSFGTRKRKRFVYGMKAPDSVTSVDGLALKTGFGTRVDCPLKDVVTTGVHTDGGMQCSLSPSHLEVGEGVTPGSANQTWMLDYRRDGTSYPDTRFDLRCPIKHTMF